MLGAATGVSISQAVFARDSVDVSDLINLGTGPVFRAVHIALLVPFLAAAIGFIMQIIVCTPMSHNGSL